MFPNGQDNEVRELYQRGERKKTEQQLTPIKPKTERNASTASDSNVDKSNQEVDDESEQLLPCHSQCETKDQPPSRFSPGYASLYSLSMEPTSHNKLEKLSTNA